MSCSCPCVGLVFTNAIGQNALGVLRTSFPALISRADVPRIRFHDLRHTAATLLLGQGVHPKIVSEMLGHSTIAITLDLLFARDADDAARGRGRPGCDPALTILRT